MKVWSGDSEKVDIPIKYIDLQLFPSSFETASGRFDELEDSETMLIFKNGFDFFTIEILERNVNGTEMHGVDLHDILPACKRDQDKKRLLKRFL
jgi:hypothetical protein